MLSENYLQNKTKFGIIAQRKKILATFWLVASVPCEVVWEDGKKERTELRVPVRVGKTPKMIRDIVGKQFDREFMGKIVPKELDELLAKVKKNIADLQEKKVLNNLTFKELYEV